MQPHRTQDTYSPQWARRRRQVIEEPSTWRVKQSLHGIPRPSFQRPRGRLRRPHLSFPSKCHHPSRTIKSSHGENWRIDQNNPDQAAYARALWERIRRECKLCSPSNSGIASSGRLLRSAAHFIDLLLTLLNSPRAADLYFLRSACWTSPGGHVWSEFVHARAVWSLRSLAGYQSGPA